MNGDIGANVGIVPIDILERQKLRQASTKTDITDVFGKATAAGRIVAKDIDFVNRFRQRCPGLDICEANKLISEY